MSSPHIVILGGGLGGLVAAHAARAALPSARFTLLERSHRLGGWLRSERVAGALFEHGCRGLRPSGSGASALRLIERLGLVDEALLSAPAAGARFLLQQGSLQPLPTRLLQAARSPITRGAPGWLLRDLLAPPGPAAASAWATTEAPRAALRADESVASFVERHFGSHVARVLLDAALGGIYAGDIDALSARSVLGALWRAEAEGAWAGGSRASVALGLLRAKLRGGGGGGGGAMAAVAAATPPSEFSKRAAAATSVSFREGMGALPAALEAALRARDAASGAPPVDLRLGIAAEALEVDEAGGTGAAARPQLRVRCTGGGSLLADGVLCALPAPALGQLLAASPNPMLRGAAAAAARVPMASVAAVGLAWRGGAARGLLPHAGFGFLVPRREREARGCSLTDPLLGMTWDSAVFPGQQQGGVDLQQQQRARGAEDDTECRVTVMLGGATAPHVEGWGAEELEAAALRAARTTLLPPGTQLPKPHAVLPALALRAIPQYTVGHAARLAEVEEGLRRAFPCTGVALVGNSWRGVGAADVVAGAVEAAEAMMMRVGKQVSGLRKAGSA